MAEYDPRLVQLYDLDNPDGADHDYYRALVTRLGARSVLDLGCGTGILTVTFAADGRTVVGVDPSATMLAYAAARAGAGGVRWIIGDSQQIPNEVFDCVVMTGNVAQHIPDGEWERTLSDIARALRPGGVLAFESRNPAGTEWARWATREAEATTRHTAHGLLREWMDVVDVSAGRVQLRAHNVFVATGEHVVMEEALAFRESGLLQAQLEDAGFAVEAIWGGWDRSAESETSPLLVIEARRQ